MTPRPTLFEPSQIPKFGRGAATDVINKELCPAVIRLQGSNRPPTGGAKVTPALQLLSKWRKQLGDDRLFINIVRAAIEMDPPPRNIIGYLAARVAQEGNRRR